MICSNCGAQLPDAVAFCDKCGCKLNNLANNSPVSVSALTADNLTSASAPASPSGRFTANAVETAPVPVSNAHTATGMPTNQPTVMQGDAPALQILPDWEILTVMIGKNAKHYLHEFVLIDQGKPRVRSLRTLTALITAAYRKQYDFILKQILIPLVIVLGTLTLLGLIGKWSTVVVVIAMIGLFALVIKVAIAGGMFNKTYLKNLRQLIVQYGITPTNLHTPYIAEVIRKKAGVSIASVVVTIACVVFFSIIASVA
jgi:hypothetical protein